MSKYRWRSAAIAILVCPLLSAQDRTSTAGNAHPFAKTFQPFLDDHSMAGAVFLVADRTKVLDEETIGYADLATKRPMRTNQEFWIASMSKSFAGTALMMLVDEGKVKIDDPVEKYLPEFRNLMVQTPSGLVAANHPILVREILSHTSGIAKEPDNRGIPLAEQVKATAKTPLQSQPGTKYLYTNPGINTVGRIVEVASGMPYEQFLQERIFTPLGMKDTTFWPNDEQKSRLATAYHTDEKTGEQTALPAFALPDATYPKVYAWPSAGLFSTASDILKFCQMLLNGGEAGGHRYLSQAAIDTMSRTYTTPATGGSYGLGWQIEPNGYLHQGAFLTRMMIEPRNGLVEILMTQIVAPFTPRQLKVTGEFTHVADQAFAPAPNNP